MKLEEEYKRFQFQYGIILLRTKRFQNLMDRLGQYRISKPVGWALLYLMPVAAAVGLFFFMVNLEALFSPSVHVIGVAVRGITPLAYLGLPGINPYLPIVDGWVALIVAMVVHEGAHGVVARSLGFPVKASGLLLLLFLPIGAFVEVDETALKAAKARDSGRILAAGASVNFVLGVIFLLLLFSVVSTMAPVAQGIGVGRVDTSSPAAAKGISPGDLILTVNGVHYDDPAQIVVGTWYRPGEAINLTVWRAGQVIAVNNLVLTANPGNASLGYLGVQDVHGYSELKAAVSGYTGSFFTKPITYLCIPTFPRCESVAPFSDQLAVFYTSSYGESLVPLANLFYWFFFLNFNLAIFNALPIYPLDGGQAFRAGLKGLAGGRLNEVNLTRISAVVTAAVLLIILSVPLAAYLNLI